MSVYRPRLTASVALLVVLMMVAGCGVLGIDRTSRNFTIAAGGPTGVYYAYGQALGASLSNELSADISVAETNGSVDNLWRVGSQEALLGFAQGDAVADAVAGAGAFVEPLSIRAVARLYDEYVHIVVRSDSDIDDIADIAGRKFSLGAEGSGVNLVAQRILEAAGVTPASVHNPELGLEASILALSSSEIEGFFWMGGLPTPGITQLAESDALRLLAVDAQVVALVNARHAGVYRSAEFPAGMYGQAATTMTMTVPSFLITSADAPDNLVREVLQVLFDERSVIAQSVPAAALLDRRLAIFTDPIALHPGAADYYSSTRR